MTDINKFNPYPDIFNIKCPKCEGKAEFRFKFLLTKEDHSVPMWPSASTIKWGNWTVIEHDPKLYKWKEPSGGYKATDEGIYNCTKCVGRFKAYFKLAK